MTIFELVRIALDDLYEEGRDEHGDELDGIVIQRLNYLSRNYAQLTNPNREPVNYRDTSTRLAYIYTYVAAHADYLVQVLEKAQARLEEPLFDVESLRVTCLGGGPGSDLIGILKYLDENREREGVKKLKCYLLDREQAWADSWTELDESLQAKVDVNVNFQPLDVTEPESWAHQRKFLQADLFTLIFFASEVHSLDGNGVVSDFWRSVLEAAKSGAIFVFIDNGHTRFTDSFDALCNEYRLERIYGHDGVRYTPRFDEQASELSEYTEVFGRNPRVQGIISVRVLRKP